MENFVNSGKMDADGEESQELVKHLREIPYRLMAMENGLDERSFMEKVYNKEPYKSFFLERNCEERFLDAAIHLLHRPEIQHQFNQITEEREEKKRKKNTGTQAQSSRQSYSEVVSQLPHTSDGNSGVTPKTQHSGALTAEYLSHISPSALSETFIEYSTIDFDSPRASLSAFDECHEILVDSFLRLINSDEKFICLMVIFGFSPEETSSLKTFARAYQIAQYGHDLVPEQKQELQRKKKKKKKQQPPNTPIMSSANSNSSNSVATSTYFTHFPELPKPGNDKSSNKTARDTFNKIYNNNN